MATDYINQNEVAYKIIKEETFGTLPTTGTMLDLPAETGQAPLTYSTAMIEDNTQRPNRETAAPTRGHASSTGTFNMPFRPCAAIDLLIESAIAGLFDEDTGIAFGGETDVFFSMITKLTERGGYQGYQDTGITVNSFGLSGTAREGVTASFEFMGSKRVELTTANALAVTPATAQAFNYIDVKNISIGGQTLEFVSLEFSTGTSHDHRIVFGQKEATSLAATGNRTTTLNLSGFRKGFEINNLIGDEPIEVKFEIARGTGADRVGYRITLPAAVCNSPTDELTDTGLLLALEFTAHFDEVAQAGIIIEKL